MKGIHYSPRAPLSLLARRPSPAMAEALAFAPRLFQFSRDALHAWFSAREPGVVWMPSFHCGMEVRAAVDAGFTPRFYRVGADLTIDEDHLIAGLREHPGPVLVIHYFGFPQPGIVRIAALCRAQGVPLVEDCSHAFLASHDGRPLGTFGDAATFSLYKSLGTVDGGALRGDGSGGNAQRPLVAWSAHAEAWERHRRGSATIDIATLERRFAARVVSARERIFETPWRYGSGISRLSLALIARIDPQRVRATRRANYLRLAALIGGAPPLPDGAVPLFLPLFVRDRERLLFRLQSRAIEPFIFGYFHHPDLDPAAFPEARRLREELLCLPVHQQLEGGDLERIARSLE
ncbi:MAG: Perosamine synthase [Acidobacteria bacterium]|nr:Perosamine synthase [Acidobacteriota bacterium]